jgi:hypothetical protein
MIEKYEAVRLAENLENQWWGLTASPSGLPEISLVAVAALRVDAARLLRKQHADNERLRGLLAEAREAVWLNYDGDLLDRIEAALKEVPR